jgi:antitoxin MazE
MEGIMEVSIIKIGNSKGLRLSKSILDKYQIKDKVEVILEEGQIVLKPIDQPRKGWDQAFKKMHENGDDQLLIDDVFEEESFDQWD